MVQALLRYVADFEDLLNSSGRPTPEQLVRGTRAVWRLLDVGTGDIADLFNDLFPRDLVDREDEDLDAADERFFRAAASQEALGLFVASGLTANDLESGMLDESDALPAWALEALQNWLARITVADRLAVRAVRLQLDAPQDETAYVPISWLEDRGRFSSIKRIKTALQQNAWIRRRKPSKQRLLVHAGDWHIYTAIQDRQSLHDLRVDADAARAIAHARHERDRLQHRRHG